MDTSALKSFAPEVRRQLLEAVERKLDFVLTGDTADLRAAAAQVERLRTQAEAGRTQLIERVTYTWFNRLTALRFLDARGWHRFRARVLTPASPQETQPEILRLLRTGVLPEELKAHTDLGRLNDLLDGRLPSFDPQAEAYRHLVLAACRFYHTLLPFLFERLDDETELLLPDDLLTEHSVAQGFRTEISDQDCAEVEVLGWLYQFYISEKKDQVMSRKGAVASEDIPAVTQLFTPHWIVRYLVENSLGRLWMMNRPGSRLREHMPYYIEGEPETDFLKITKPEEIRLLDPAVGSGHMLTFAFDLLTLIYEEEGYAPTEVPALILRHNLFGLEVCPRAAQLAELALVFKAREKSRRYFQPEHIVRPAIIELRDVRFAEDELRDYIHALGLGDLFNDPLLKLLHQFEEAKNFGSLIQPCLDERTITDVRRAIEGKDLGGQLFLRETHLKVVRVLEQAEALTQRYHVVVANPPYMGRGGMNPTLKNFAEKAFSTAKSDLFAMFLSRVSSFSLGPRKGYCGLMTPFSWMFLSSYEQLRKDLLTKHTFLSLVKPSYTAFFDSAIVSVCAFVVAGFQNEEAPITFFDLDYLGNASDQPVRFAEALHNPSSKRRFVSTAANFKEMPGTPLAFWASSKVVGLFSRFPSLGSICTTREGLATGDNDRFLRFWHEVSQNRRAADVSCVGKPQTCDRRWFNYVKGGNFRKWWGNFEYVVNWENDGKEIRSFEDKATGRIRSHNYNGDYAFRAGFTWSGISSGAFSARLVPETFMFDAKGPMGFPKEPSGVFYLQSFLNSRVTDYLIRMLAPTVDFKLGHVLNLPLATMRDSGHSELTKSCIELSRVDWDNFETSWDFLDQPLLRPGLKGATLQASWRNWEAQSTGAIRRMQELETENNRLFIAAYGLDGELQPAVPEEQITLARADARRDMAAFLSYAVGCMMGRYGLDQPGLILADAGDTVKEYLAKVKRPLDKLTFPPDEDGIIPVLNGEWFEDDIVARTRDFLRATFGDAALEENLRFIEDSLGKDLRRYFAGDFYKDHLQTYKKRPIYWLFQSPKKGFQCLVYLHRYTRDTPHRVLNRYLREYLAKIGYRLEHLDHVLASESTPHREKTRARKESDNLRKTLRECEEWEREVLLPLAQQRLELDLDDGVKVNYLKLGKALAPISGLAGRGADA